MSTGTTAFLAGETMEALRLIARMLLDKPRARREAARVQWCLRCLSSFYHADLRRLRVALAAAGVQGTFIDQDERDALFITTADAGAADS